MRTSEEIKDLAAALVSAQAAMEPAKKDADNAHFKSKYADLSAIVSAIRKPLTEAGLSWVQDVTLEDGGIGVTTRLTHTSGQWIEFGPLVIPVDKANAHGVGSAATYAKRYGLAAACGLATEDDDGNAAAQAAPAPPEKPEGFDDAWLDFAATADEGMAALTAAWKASREDFRAYATVAKKKELAALKAKAGKAPVSA